MLNLATPTWVSLAAWLATGVVSRCSCGRWNCRWNCRLRREGLAAGRKV